MNAGAPIAWGFGIEQLGALAELARVPILGLTLALARMLAFANIMPAFTRLGLAGLVRNAVGIVMVLPIWPGLLDPALEAAARPALAVLALILKEGLVGTGLGLAYGIPLWAAEAAGDLMEQQRGSDAATMPDPDQSGQATVLGTLVVLVLLTLFFAGGGLELALGGIWASFRAWPLDALAPGPLAALGGYGLLLLDRLMRLSLLLAGPILLALLLAEIALALVGRIAPNLNVFDLSLAVKSLVTALLLPVYVVFLAGHMRRLLTGLADLPGEIGAVLQ